MQQREVDIVVLSDLHLGTYGCHARELLQYLESINPRTVVLNGDIIDIWQFSKRYWPPAHMMVIQHLVGLVAKGIPVYYIPGNHDEMLRRFEGFEAGSFSITNKLSLKIDGARIWIFHGDIFDVVMQHSKWLAKLGAVGYDSLILFNSLVNYVLRKMGRKKISLSKRIKNSVKSAVKFISNFEESVGEFAIANKFDYVVCGHIHHPDINTFATDAGSVVYMNSGDWIENLSSLEYNDGKWEVYRYAHDPLAQSVVVRNRNTSSQQLMNSLLDELNIDAGNRKQRKKKSRKTFQNADDIEWFI